MDVTVNPLERSLLVIQGEVEGTSLRSLGSYGEAVDRETVVDRHKQDGRAL
jgi:hypothetical protein